jgi:CheY-like chemotaxis protein/HPt (histidine-containing phosphotransfer) domain-containing protein
VQSTTQADQGGHSSQLLLRLFEPPITGPLRQDRPSEPTTPSCLRILLVEDDVTNRDVALLMLSQLGYRADVAQNGIEAIAAVHAASYEVILMDIQMPEMDGMEATRRIRSELSATVQPVIVAMTASITIEYQLLCLEAGMDHHLPKPIRLGELRAILGNWVPRHQGTPSVEPDLLVLEHSNEQEPSDPGTPSNFRAENPNVYDSATHDILIADLGANGKAMWRILVDSYLQDGNTLAAIRVAAHAHNAEALAFTAHALKSASATLGLLALSSAASRLEAAFQTAPESFDVADEALKLVAEYHRATSALRLAREADDAAASK